MALTAAEFELLLQANRTLSSKLDVDEVLRTVLDLATQVVGAEASSILLLDEKTDELFFNVAIGSAKDDVKQIRLKSGEGIAGWVAKEKRSLIVNDVTHDSRFTARVDKSTSFTTKSILAVPLSTKGRVIGVVEAINKKNGREFSVQDQEIFEVFAGQSAVAVENAQLFSAVKLEREKLKTVFARMNDGVLLLDENGTVALLNDAAAKYTGHSPEQGIGKKFGGDLFSNFQVFPSREDLEKMSAETAFFDLSRNEVKDLFLSAFVRRLPSQEKDRPGGYMVILRDVTEETKEGRLKRNFLSLISHKLKTPLTVIVGYAPGLMSIEQGLNEFQKKALKSVCGQAEHLSGLVDKLLRFSVIESDDTIMKNDIVKIDEFIRDAVGFFDDAVENEGLVFNVRGDLAQIPSIPMDRSMGMEVMKNLIENSIKFNDKERKEIEISAALNGDCVSIGVSDNGIGIPSEETEKIFQKFYQIENSFTGQIPGAGLGLAFCKKVVEAMGGTVTLESRIKKGSTFYISLPVK